MVTQWTDEESGITIYIHTAFANSEDGTVDFTLEPEEPEEGEDAPVYLYTGQYEDDEDPTESEDPEDYIWTYTGYDPAQEPNTSEAGDIEEPVELDPLVEAGLPEEAARMIRENRTDFEGNQDATDQTITNPNELVGTNHGASGYTVTSGLTAAAISDPVYAEGESAIRCCRITCQTAGANASVSFGADELEQKILDALDTLEENSVFTYTLSFDVRMSNPAVTGDITLGDLLTFPAFDPDDYIIGEDDPEPDDEGAEEEAAAGDEEATPDPDGSEVDDEADDQAGPVDITDIWVHYSATADVDQSGTAGAALTIPVTMACGDTLDIANLKIEAGAMATAWKVSAIEAEAAARAAQAAADAAMEMAQATNKHFFYANATGAHVTTVENEPDQGKNVLIDSNGLYIRENTDTLAEFTADGSRIGQDSEAHVVVSPNEMALHLDETEKPFSISVAEDAGTKFYERVYNISAAESTSVVFALPDDAPPIKDDYGAHWISVDIVLTTPATTADALLSDLNGWAQYYTSPVGDTLGRIIYSENARTLTVTPSVRTVGTITITYKYAVPAPELEFGTEASASGANAVAIGAFAVATDDHAIAIGREAAADYDGISIGIGTKAGINLNAVEFAVGRYNDEGTGADTLLAIGNGGSDDNRSNALEIGPDGSVRMGGELFFHTRDGIAPMICSEYGDRNGSDVLIRPGGRLIIGGGEYASNRYDAGSFEGVEAAWIGSDSAVFIESNGNTIASRKKWTFSATGDLIAPNGAVYEAAYKGETVTLTGANLIGNGYSGGSAIYIELPLPKKIAEGSSVNLTTFTAGLRGVKGTIAANGTNLLANTTVARSNAGGLRLTISGQTTNFMANTPVSAVVSNLTITVS